MDIATISNQIKAKFAAIKASNSSAASQKSISRPNILKPIFKPLYHIIGKIAFDSEKVLGLEISPHYIRICQMKKSYGRWSLNQLASACMENQYTNNDIILSPELYSQNLIELINKHGIKTKNVAISVPSSGSIIKIINMPDMEESDLEAAAQIGAIWESMVQLEGSIGEYSVYYKILRHKIKPSTSLALRENSVLNDLSSLIQDNPSSSEALTTDITSDTPLFTSPEAPMFTAPEIGPQQENQPAETSTELPQIDSQTEEALSSNPSENSLMVANTETLNSNPTETTIEEEASSMDVLFVASKLENIALYANIASSAGLNPIAADIKCNVIKQAFDLNPDKAKIAMPYALLEFGSDENVIYIVNNMSVQSFKLTISDEEKQLLARNSYTNEEIQIFFSNYAAQLGQILETYQLQNTDNSKVNEIFVTSNTPLHVDNAASHPLINVFIEQMAPLLGSYKLSNCNFCNHIEVPTIFAKKVNAEGNLAAWATVLGLATYKLDCLDYSNDNPAIDKVNLLPTSKFQKHSQKTKILSTLIMLAVFCISILGIFGTFGLASGTKIVLSKNIESLENIKTAFVEKNNELQKLSIVMDRVKSLDKVRNTVPSNQLQIIAIYKTIGDSIPEGVWLTELKYTAPLRFEITGNAVSDQSILDFVDKLNEIGTKSRTLKKVSLKLMNTEAKSEKAKTETGKGAASQTITTPSSSPVKNFSLQGELIHDANSKKLEFIAAGAK